jgi:hypothetical protein
METGQKKKPQGSQVSSACPGKSRVKLKVLVWLEAVDWDWGRGILIFLINVELYNLEK